MRELEEKQANISKQENLEAARKGFAISVSVLVISSCIIIVMVVVVVMCYFASRKKHRDINAPLPHMLSLLEDRGRTVSVATIKEVTRKVISYLPAEMRQGSDKEGDQVHVRKLLDEIRNAEQEKREMEMGETEIIQGARDKSTLPIKKRYRLHFLEYKTNLHISKLEDFYGNRVLVSMAPLRTQFVDQWEAIWRQGVGVIVWLGKFVESGQSHMDPYIPLTENESIYYGHVHIETVYASKRYLEYDTYRVIIRHARRLGKREVTIFHGHSWQQSRVSSTLQKDVDLLRDIKNQHAIHIMAGLPTVLFQCTHGTAGSNTLLAAYIGFQMWSHCKRVNLHGVLRYIRQRRWMAFEQTGDKNQSFLSQIQIAYAVVYATAKWHETRTVSSYERWMKNILRSRDAALETATASAPK